MNGNQTVNEYLEQEKIKFLADREITDINSLALIDREELENEFINQPHIIDFVSYLQEYERRTQDFSGDMSNFSFWDVLNPVGYVYKKITGHTSVVFNPGETVSKKIIANKKKQLQPMMNWQKAQLQRELQRQKQEKELQKQKLQDAKDLGLIGNPADDKPKGMSKGLKIGIGAGALVLIIVIAYFIIKK